MSNLEEKEGRMGTRTHDIQDSKYNPAPVEPLKFVKISLNAGNSCGQKNAQEMLKTKSSSRNILRVRADQILFRV